MKSTQLTVVLSLLTLSFLTVSLRADTTPGPVTKEINGVKVTYGPTTVKLGKVAEIKLPEGFEFIGPDSLERYLELTQNPRSGNEVGVINAPNGWTMFFEYQDVGYIKDNEKNDLDAEKLYKQLDEGTQNSNPERKARGWAEQKMRGWAAKPYYDEKTKNLKWAFKFSTSRDQYQAITVNENIRLLGRGGVMEVTLACSDPDFKMLEPEADKLLTDFRYVSGQTYAEFKSGDKIAKYGLAALVVGGAGAVAAKTGLLAKLGVLLVKGGKAIIFVFVAIFAGIARFFKKLVGKDKVE